MKKENEKPGFLAVDFLIQSRLKEVGLILSSIRDLTKEDIALDEGVTFFKNELLRREKLTSLVFFYYTSEPILEVFAEIDLKKSFTESPSLGTLAVILTGYTQAGLNFRKEFIQNENWFKLFTEIPNLFEQKEIDSIVFCLKDILTEFPNQLKEAIKWLREDIEPEKKQKDVFIEMVSFLQSNKGKIDGDNPEFKELSQKFLNVCMPGNGVSHDHNMYILKSREEALIYSPPKKLLINIERMFTYLDIISYAGYIPEKLPKNPQELNFKKTVPFLSS